MVAHSRPVGRDLQCQCRAQVVATPFRGGEGFCIMDGRQIFLTTKYDDHVWRYDITGPFPW